MDSALIFTAIARTIPGRTRWTTSSFSTGRLGIISRTPESVFGLTIIDIISITICTVTTITAFVIATDTIIVTLRWTRRRTCEISSDTLTASTHFLSSITPTIISIRHTFIFRSTIHWLICWTVPFTFLRCSTSSLICSSHTSDIEMTGETELIITTFRTIGSDIACTGNRDTLFRICCEVCTISIYTRIFTFFSRISAICDETLRIVFRKGIWKCRGKFGESNGSCITEINTRCIIAPSEAAGTMIENKTCRTLMDKITGNVGSSILTETIPSPDISIWYVTYLCPSWHRTSATPWPTCWPELICAMYRSTRARYRTGNINSIHSSSAIGTITLWLTPRNMDLVISIIVCRHGFVDSKSTWTRYEVFTGWFYTINTPVIINEIPFDIHRRICVGTRIHPPSSSKGIGLAAHKGIARWWPWYIDTCNLTSRDIRLGTWRIKRKNETAEKENKDFFFR